MLNELEEMNKMLHDKGDVCDLGWHEAIDEKLFEQIKQHSDKPYCLIKDWCWWDLECNEKSQAALEKMDLLPSLIYSTYVLDDEQGRFNLGDNARTSMLTKLHSTAFFETQTTMYVLIGKGTRKTVNPTLVAKIFY
jgi:hypothetical protein